MESVMELTVEVTEADISNGVQCFCEECPVAIAVYRALVDAHPDLSELIPSANYCRLYLVNSHGDTVYTARTPSGVKHFIRNFDCGQPVEPQTFTVDFIRPVEWHS